MADYTEHYQLHQWVPEDDFLRTDFNTDFAKIDAALAGLAADLEESDAARETLAGRPELTWGSYAGSGEETQSVSLGFAPRAVLSLTAGGYTYRSQSGRGYGGLALPSLPVTFGEGNDSVALTAVGFQVAYVPDDGLYHNYSGLVYHYLAWR